MAEGMTREDLNGILWGIADPEQDNTKDIEEILAEFDRLTEEILKLKSRIAVGDREHKDLGLEFLIRSQRIDKLEQENARLKESLHHEAERVNQLELDSEALERIKRWFHENGIVSHEKLAEIAGVNFHEFWVMSEETLASINQGLMESAQGLAKSREDFGKRFTGRDSPLSKQPTAEEKPCPTCGDTGIVCALETPNDAIDCPTCKAKETLIALLGRVYFPGIEHVAYCHISRERLVDMIADILKWHEESK